MPARDALPVLLPGTPVLARIDGRIHIGADPRTATVVSLGPGVTVSAVVALLHRLRTPQRYRHLRRQLRSSGLTATRFWQLVDELVESGRAVEADPGTRAPLRVAVAGHGEIAALLLDGLPRDGHRVVACDPRDPLGDIGRRPALVVVADQPVPDPVVWEPLMAAGVPHLAVHVRDDVGVVGPLVLPGLSSCLRCVELHRTDLDEAWPVIAATLHGVAGAGGTAARLSTVAVAHAQIAEIADQRFHRESAPPTTIGTTIEFHQRPCRMEVRPAPVHPRCGCFNRYSDAPGGRLSTILDHAAKGHH
ncbi:hypothetical protein [Gordonia neofelifaecis]|nr:hypothetical protein [Gordonia neofelifaecis]